MASMISGENLSDISFKRKKIEKEVVGVVYVVTNDYHTQKESALRDHGADWKTMEQFFELCEDKYYVVSKQSVTAKKFLATCNYLANYSDYPACCDRIIIYFAGHGRDGYIRLDIDYSDIQKGKDSKKLKRREDDERLEESKIDIEHILSIFRHHTIKEKMSIILLLDACCNAKSVECEEHELVASAASETASKKFGAKSDHSGGYWTNTLFYVLNKTDEKYDIIKLLKEAQIKIKEIYNDEELNPTFVQHLQREICFRKRMKDIIMNLKTGVGIDHCNKK